MLNLESRWILEEGPTKPSNNEVEERTGNAGAEATFLTGGLANHNYDIGNESILRIYKRSQQSSTIDLESNLNGLDWMSFETPKTLEHGSDFLIQKSSTSRNWKTRSNMAGYRVEY